MERYVRSCDACQRNKVVRHAPFGLLSPLPIPTRPWLSVSLDWITDLPPSHYHDAVLVVVDRLTKQAIFIPTTKSMAAPDVASLFVQHVVRVHGLPQTLVSDRDPLFTSHYWTRLLELCGIRANRSTAFVVICKVRYVILGLRMMLMGPGTIPPGHPTMCAHG